MSDKKSTAEPGGKHIPPTREDLNDTREGMPLTLGSGGYGGTDETVETTEERKRRKRDEENRKE